MNSRKSHATSCKLRRKAIREKANQLIPTSNFYLKTLRVDMKNDNNIYFPNYYFPFIMELIDPVKNSYPKRLGDKCNFTVNGEGIYTRETHYQHLAPLKTAQYTEEEKEGFTHFQCATLAILPDLLPVPCAFNGYKTVLAGVIIEEKDVLPSNRLYTQDGDTIRRPYDFFTYTKAYRYHKKNQDIIYPAARMEKYKLALLSKHDNSHSEPLVRFRLNADGSFKTGIMEDNLESRLLGKQYAINLQAELHKKQLCSHDYTLSTIYYTPNDHELLFKEYTDEEYALDCDEAVRLYRNKRRRENKYMEGRFEFLLGLPMATQQIALLKKTVTKEPLAITLLKKNNLFIFKVLKENTLLHFDKLLKPAIDNMTSEDILFMFDYALRADYEKLALYLYDKLYFDIEISHNVLIHALEKNKYAWFKKLLKKNIVEINSSDGMTVLHLAACKKDPRYIQALFKYKKSDIDIEKENGNGYTPLMVAAYYGSVDVLKALLDNDQIKPNINHHNKKGNTALIYAAYTGQSEALAVLLKNDQLDIYFKNKQGRSARYFAERNKDRASLEFLDDKVRSLEKTKNQEIRNTLMEVGFIVASLGMYAYLKNCVDRREKSLSTPSAIAKIALGVFLPPVAMVAGMLSLFCLPNKRERNDKYQQKSNLTNNCPKSAFGH